MTRKDFELIAKAFHDTKPKFLDRDMSEAAVAAAYDAWSRTVHRIALALSSTNPRFNVDRFIEACSFAK